MKKYLTLPRRVTRLGFYAVAFTSLAFGALAASNLQTFSGYGNASTPASIIIPAIPTAQTSIISVWYTSDTNNATISFSGGAGAYYQTATNALSSSITNIVNSTNGLLATSTMVLQHAGTCYSSTLTSYGNYAITNAGVITWQPFLVLASGGWGVNSSVNDDVYQMAAPQVIYTGAGTNALNGVAIFVANQGRPVIVSTSTPFTTNRLSSVTAQYN